MINKLLITCLQRNKRLIIPDLGAFIRKNIDGVGVILVFVPFLKKDDGVLLSAIESWAGIEADDATEILKEYVSQIKNSLDTRGQYVIEGVGVLKYDANGVIYLAKPNEAAPAHQRVLERDNESREEPTPKPQPSVRDKNREEVLGELAASVNRIVSRSEQESGMREEHTEPRPRKDYDEQRRSPYDSDDYGRRSPIQQGNVGSSFYNPSAPSQSGQPQNTPQPVRMGYMAYGGPQPAQSPQPGQPSPQPIGRAQQREQHRENLYGTSSSQGARPVTPVQGQSRAPQQRQRPAVRQAPARNEKKGGNTVFYVAIIALILAVGVVLYGFIFGNETPLDNQLFLEQMSDNTTDIPVVE